ncbi:hypothetical protein LSTR_LSTR000113 [Laodelphax striatellus]|uniref:Uncharacterized protein n=1 Tax=Laodelphax striatellus TaxID=195883 RepID=A0A482X690_LAOST|nr:hypothetical protein LSTR_LSTR000113 [Laodelphax striatellus]
MSSLPRSHPAPAAFPSHLGGDVSSRVQQLWQEQRQKGEVDLCSIPPGRNNSTISSSVYQGITRKRGEGGIVYWRFLDLHPVENVQDEEGLLSL